ncbi:hypothetical protein C8Q80DRAFT_689085 [Daedaleopsis nitida]|nr:hypothetical protein C8Q80DRAFT_689085 [Daedaleopsis nitida]
MGKGQSCRVQAKDVNTKGKKPTGRNVGKLTELLNVPMDVFFEITSHLYPVDILQLARTSRHLRTMLLSRASRHMWIAARKNISPPPPDPPEYVSEPEYAYLLFERFCMLCGAGRAVNVHYAGRARLCRGCWAANVKKGNRIAKDMGYSIHKDKETIKLIANMLPVANRDNLDRWGVHLEAVNQSPTATFYEPDFVEVVEQFRQITPALGDENTLEKFIEERKKFTLERLNFRRVTITWYGKWLSKKEAVSAEAGSERGTAIEEKLRELGYEPKDYPEAYDHEWFQMLNQPRKLTPRIWNAIRPKMVAILEKERERREEIAHYQRWDKRRVELCCHYETFLKTDSDHDLDKRTMPNSRDALSLPSMDTLLTSEEPTAPISEEQFKAIEGAIRTEAEKRRITARATLAAIFRQSCSRWAMGGLPPKLSALLEGEGQSGNGLRLPHLYMGAAPENPDADLALLSSPYALFCCMTYDHQEHYSYIGFLEHWQTPHPDTPWYRFARTDTENIHVIPRLLEAIGADEDITQAELDALVRSGRPVCSCGEDPFPQYESRPKYLALHELINHLYVPAVHQGVWSSDMPKVDLTCEAAKVLHRITFE